MKRQLLLGAMLMGSFFTATAQDDCSSALNLPVGTTSVDEISGFYEDNCWAAADADAANWYMYTATANGNLRVNTNLDANDPDEVDTRISVYSGTCDDLLCWSGSDDVSDTNYLTDFQFPVLEGETYYIAFDNQWSAAPFEVEVTFIEPTCGTSSIDEDWSMEVNYNFCWAAFNPNEDDLAWQYNAINDLNGDGEADPVALIFPPTAGNEAKDEWLISSGKSLVAGTEYTVSITYNGFDFGGFVSDETIELVMLTELDPEADGESIGTVTGIEQEGELETLEQDATTSEFTFTPDADGTYFLGIHATSDDATSLLILFDVAMTGGPAGVDEVLASKFSVFPNPANNVINIANAENILVNGVVITDLNGRTVKSTNYNGVTEAQINIADLASGMYMMTVSSDKGTMTKKIVKN
jgi:hypothetical protein